MLVRVLGPIDIIDAVPTTAVRGDRGSTAGRTSAGQPSAGPIGRSVGTPAQERLLALLLAAGPEGRTVGDLVVLQWYDAEPPADPVATLRTYVGRLRSAVGAARVETLSGGYRLIDVPTDIDQLERSVALAREAAHHIPANCLFVRPDGPNHPMPISSGSSGTFGQVEWNTGRSPPRRSIQMVPAEPI